MRLTVQREFPVYTPAEHAVDRAVHVVGLLAASVALCLLLARLEPHATLRQLAAISIYAVGLIGMLSASALYNAARPSPRKATLLALDQSMIFVMIAGSYTPFALIALPASVGEPLCAFIWCLAASGIAIRLALPAVARQISLALYLGMGWVVVAFMPTLLRALPADAMVLLVGGGVVYSAGSFIQTRASLRFHNAIWHAMVVVAASMHLGAIALIGSAAMHAGPATMPSIFAENAGANGGWISPCPDAMSAIPVASKTPANTVRLAHLPSATFTGAPPIRSETCIDLSAQAGSPQAGSAQVGSPQAGSQRVGSPQAGGR